jgi:hypothetical protein
LHNFFSLSCFSHKPEKFRNKFRAKTFLGEKIGPDAKVLDPDVKVLVPDVKVLVPGCGSTGPRMQKYWSPGCVKFCPEMLLEKIGTFLRKMKAYGCLYRQNYSLSEIVIFWWNPSLRNIASKNI